MTGNINVEKVQQYWFDSAEKDLKTMLHLFDSKDYHWSLFIGHLVIEKMLKAIIVKETNDHAPFLHDLRRLGNMTRLDFSKSHLMWLDTITTFNLNARYDSYKQEFYRKCTHEFTTIWINNIKVLTEWIKTRQ